MTAFTHRSYRPGGGAVLRGATDCPERAPGTAPPSARWTVHCGIHGLAQLFAASVSPALGPVGGRLHLILDLPWGFALTSPHLRDAVSLVITQHPCPEYWEDVWDLGGGSLLAGTLDPEAIGRAAQAAGTGERVRLTPPARSALRPRERLILRYVALGWTNERIGLHLDWSDKTVRNKLIHLFAALGVQDRKEAALYYWGLLDRVVPGVCRQH